MVLSVLAWGKRYVFSFNIFNSENMRRGFAVEDYNVFCIDAFVDYDM